MQKNLTIAISLVSALFIAGCAGESMKTLSTNNETWRLTHATFHGKPLSLAGNVITLSFAGGEAMVGNAAINNYRAPVSIQKGKITHTGSLITTRMAGPLPVMQLESDYLSALREVQDINRSGDKLTITGPNEQLDFQLNQ